uniref:Uncharacterized protein n=1 Tax=Anopheles maculatus TaxID=74869 RepID=A0A182SJK5_9DIPT
MPKRVKQCRNKDIVITADKNETNVTASSADNGCISSAVKSSNISDIPASTLAKGTDGAKEKPAGILATSAPRCCDAPLCNNSRKCIVRQKSQKIVLAPSSGEDHIYHIYGRCEVFPFDDWEVNR